MEAAGIRYIVYPSRSDEIRIWNLADIHWFNAGCAKDRFIRDRDAIAADPYSFWVGGGDYAEYISPTDRRWDPDALDGTLSVKDLGSLGRKQQERVEQLLKPIRHKCLGLVLGNHELKYQKAKEQTFLHAWMCSNLGVPNLEYSALFDIIFARKPRVKRPRLLGPDEQPSDGGTRRRIRFYIHHGAGGAKTPAGKLKRLIDFMEFFDAQVYMIGHVHGRSGDRVVSIGANAACDALVERERVGIITGTYLRTYSQGVTTYGEPAGYRPAALGATSVTIHPQSGKITPNI